MTRPPAARCARAEGRERWVLFGGAALLLVSWTLALAVLAPRPDGARRPHDRHPARAPGSVLSFSPSRGAGTGAGIVRPLAVGASSRPPTSAPASRRANDASDPAAAGPHPTGDGAVIRLATRWLAAFCDWEVGRAAASARGALRATSTPALARLVGGTAPRAEDGLPGLASVGRTAAFRQGRGFTVIAELRRGHEAVAIELDVVRTARGLRASGFGL